MDNNHIFQLNNATEYGGDILNVGCKEDPAHISTLPNVTNLDYRLFDEFSGQNIRILPGFVNADFLTWDPPQQYDTVILGEFLEHCTEEMFHKVIAKCYECTKPGGFLIVTTPYDPRKKYQQHGTDESKYYEVTPGITTWHQLIIDYDFLMQGLRAPGFKLVKYEKASWITGTFHHMAVCKKGEDSG